MVPDLPRDRIRELYRKILIIRRFEERLIGLKEYVFGNYVVYINQETTAVPAVAELGRDDLIFSNHRNHGHVLARGADPGMVYAEIFGRATGYNRGKGGSHHVAPTELGFPMTSAIVGGGIGLATGAGLTAKSQNKHGVCLCFFGDGALEEGAFYECMNLAALWCLPVVYLCENNSAGALKKAAGVSPSSTNASANLVDLVRPFGIHSEQVDGNDVAAVYEATREAVRRARDDSGPSFIETRTQRWPGNLHHYPELVTGETDLQMGWEKSRIPEEHREWFEKDDGVLRFTRELLESGYLTKGDVLALDSEVKNEIRNAVDFALNSTWPEPEEALRGVFA